MKETHKLIKAVEAIATHSVELAVEADSQIRLVGESSFYKMLEEEVGKLKRAFTQDDLLMFQGIYDLLSEFVGDQLFQDIAKIRPLSPELVRKKFDASPGEADRLFRIICKHAEKLSKIKNGLNGYKPMLQGMVHHKISKLGPKTKPMINRLGHGEVEDGDWRLTINDCKKSDFKISHSTQKLFDMLMCVLTGQLDYKGENIIPKDDLRVSIPLDGYIALTGGSNTKAAKDSIRKEIKSGLENIKRMNMSWKEKTALKGKDYWKTDIISAHGIVSGNIEVTFAPDFAEYVQHTNMAFMNPKLFTLKRHSYTIGKKLVTYRCMKSNIEEKRANIISVDALLSSTQLPKDVKNRREDELIVKPFETALDELVTAGILKEWEYCVAKGAALSRKQLEELTYKTLRDCYIKFELAALPKQTSKIIEAIDNSSTTLTKPRRQSRCATLTKKRGKFGAKAG